MPDRDVTERAREALNNAWVPRHLVIELVEDPKSTRAEVVRLRALLNPVEDWHGVVKGNNE